MSAHPSSARSAYLLLTLTMFMWSTNFVLGRALHGQVGPYALAFIRWGIALACLAPFALPRLPAALPSLRRQWRLLLLLGVFGIGLTNTLIYLAVQSTTATNAVILNSATPVMVLLLGTLYFRQRLTRRQCLGMLLALAGALAIVLKGQPSSLLQMHFVAGDGLILCAGFCWAVYTLGLRKLQPGIPPAVLMVAMLLIGELTLLPPFLLELQSRGAPVAQWPVALGLLYLGVFPSVLAFLMYNRAIAVVGAARAASFLYLMPAFGALLSILLLGEELHWFHVLGLAFIFGGIALGAFTRASKPAPAAALAREGGGD